MERYDIFLSYSRKDQELVHRLRDLLSLSGRSVFWDVVSILPGQSWAKELEDALRNSDLIVLLWCCDTAQSKWVKHELKLARKGRKTIVPVLLCDFSPPRSVRRLQWIDLSEFVKHACTHSPIEKERPAFQYLPSDKRTGAAGWIMKLPPETGISALLIGLALIVLALWRPFPALFSPEVTQAVNVTALAVGYILAAFGYITLLVALVGEWRARRLRMVENLEFLSRLPHSSVWYRQKMNRKSAESLSSILTGLEGRS